MDLRNEVLKDGMQFFRESRTLILLFAAPLLVLLVLGGVFGKTSAEIGGTTIGLCDLDKTNLSSLFVSGIVNSTHIEDYSSKQDCGMLVEKEVQEGRLAAAVVIPAGFQNGIQGGESQNLTVIIDNSRVQTAPTIEAFMKAAVQETGQEIGTQFILQVWGKLDNAAIQLDGLLDDVASTRQNATMMRERLKETTDSLNSINLSLMDDELQAANGTVLYALSEMDSAEQNITIMEQRLAAYDEELNQTRSDLVSINDSLANASSIVAGAYNATNCSDPLFSVYCAPLDSLNATLANARNSVNDRIVKVDNARAELVQANATMQDFRKNIDAAKAGAGGAQARIANLSAMVAELDLNRRDAIQTIGDVDYSLGEIVDKSYELEDIINQSSAQIHEITSKKPESVVSPMLLAPNRLFGQRTFFDFLLPSLLPMILMFVSLFLSSTSLVREKNSGTLGRVQLSQVNRFEFAGTKVLSYTIVLVPEAVMLTIIASVVYGTFSVFDIGTWLFVFQTLSLLMLAFVAIGVVIAIYSESEATAFLASLVVGLPLLFLSGLLFPFEFMPSSIALAGLASPLTQAVLSMQSVMLYHSPQATGFGILILYAIAFTILAGLSMRRIRI